MASFPSTSERTAAWALLHLSGSESNTPDPLIYAPNNLCRRRADAILKFISASGWNWEWEIRQEFGNTPDTSKALRFLLRNGEVERSGEGGRPDPYIYRIKA